MADSEDDDMSFITDNTDTVGDYAHEIFLKLFYKYVPQSDLDTALRWEHTIAWVCLVIFAISVCCCLAFWDRVSRLRRILIVMAVWALMLAVLIFLF
jgi:hypothetical protein